MFSINCIVCLLITRVGEYNTECRLVWDYNIHLCPPLHPQNQVRYTKKSIYTKPVSNRFRFKPVWPNHIHYVVYRNWFTETGFQSAWGVFTQNCFEVSLVPRPIRKISSGPGYEATLRLQSTSWKHVKYMQVTIVYISNYSWHNYIVV